MSKETVRQKKMVTLRSPIAYEVKRFITKRTMSLVVHVLCNYSALSIGFDNICAWG